MTRAHWAHEAGILASVSEFAPVDAAALRDAHQFVEGLRTQLGDVGAAAKPEGEGAWVYRRNPEVRGTMDAFGYSYLDDKLGETQAAALPLHGERAYEALNLVNGKRSVAEINEWLLAEFGSSNPDDVLTYLKALERIDVIRRGN
jgi:hypothetical protein